MSELVSVIVPVYNVEEHLDGCISSIVNQTYNNIEVILIDDGSTDASGQICDYWSAKDNRISVIHKNNEGVSFARNAGISLAKGEYILFVDSDDNIDKNLLELCVGQFDRKTDLVIFGFRLCYNDGKVEEIHFKEKEYDLGDFEIKKNFIIGPFFRHETGWTCWNRVFRKSIIDQYSLEFNLKGKVVAEDKLFCLLYILHIKKIKCINNCLYNYNQTDNSLMRNKDTSKSIKCGFENEMSIALYNHILKNADCKKFFEIYPIIHYLLLEPSIKEAGDMYGFFNSRFKKRILDNVSEKSDLDFFVHQLNQFDKYKEILKSEYNVLKIANKSAYVNTLLGKKSIRFVFFSILRALRK